MTCVKAELFRKQDDPSKRIFAMPYDETEEYYSYLGKMRDAGYRSIIVTSEAMIRLVEKIVLNRFRITEIALAEDEDDIRDQVHLLLERIDSNPAYLVELVSLLDRLAEKSAIGIQRIGFVGRDENDIAV